MLPGAVACTATAWLSRIELAKAEQMKFGGAEPQVLLAGYAFPASSTIRTSRGTGVVPLLPMTHCAFRCAVEAA